MYALAKVNGSEVIIIRTYDSYINAMHDRMVLHRMGGLHYVHSKVVLLK